MPASNRRHPAAVTLNRGWPRKKEFRCLLVEMRLSHRSHIVLLKLLLAVAYLFSICSSVQALGVSISDVTPSRSILNGLESFVDFDTLDNLSILRQSMRGVSDFADNIADPYHVLSKNSKDMEDTSQQYDGSGYSAMKLQPRFEVHETKAGFLLTATLPKMRKEDLAIEIVENSEGRMLEITGSLRNNVHSQETRRKVLFEKSSGSQHLHTSDSSPAILEVSHLLPPTHRVHEYEKFERRIPIPLHVDISTLEAKYDDSLLVITMSATNDTGKNPQLRSVK